MQSGKLVQTSTYESFLWILYGFLSCAFFSIRICVYFELHVLVSVKVYALAETTERQTNTAGSYCHSVLSKNVTAL